MRVDCLHYTWPALDSVIVPGNKTTHVDERQPEINILFDVLIFVLGINVNNIDFRFPILGDLCLQEHGGVF